MTDLSNLVKPLVWDDHDRVDVYEVRDSFNQGPKPLFLARGSRIIGWYDDVVSAKAAAQADYTARILDALDPDAVAKIREDALREAARCAIDNQDCSPWEISDAILALIDKKGITK